jgi:hypothetical protein
MKKQTKPSKKDQSLEARNSHKPKKMKKLTGGKGDASPFVP